MIALLLGNVDYELIKRDAPVRLSIPFAYYSDGGSVERLGFGYTIVQRHEIAKIENNKVVEYLVGPELQAWNVFDVFGARVLFDRDYGERVHYQDNDRSKRIVRMTIEGDNLRQKLLLALFDLAPLALVLALFAILSKLRHRVTPSRSLRD